MAMVTLMQGDSYAVFVSLTMKETGEPITPDMVSEVEVSVGSSLRKTYTDGSVLYDAAQKQWYFIPSQEETFALKPGGYEVQARLKIPNGQFSAVKGIVIGTITILDARSERVI